MEGGRFEPEAVVSGLAGQRNELTDWFANDLWLKTANAKTRDWIQRPRRATL